MKNYLGMSCIGLLIVLGAFVQGQDLEPDRRFPTAEPARPVATPGSAFPGDGPMAQDIFEPSPFAPMTQDPSEVSPFAPAPVMMPSRRAGNDLQKALRAFASAESDDDKSGAKKKVKSELEKQYDAFLERDQARVDKLFDRLKKLEEQLEKRKAAKDRLVELKLEMLISQAEGLGWPSDNSGMIYRPSTLPSTFADPALYNPGELPPTATTPMEPSRPVPGLPNRVRGRK